MRAGRSASHIRWNVADVDADSLEDLESLDAVGATGVSRQRLHTAESKVMYRPYLMERLQINR